ncbi:MAG TPA: hypothetical protein ENK80_04025 [Rhodobacterales bacterium]|nr:hypothetical protein [Rhodobacterales bacterium]
MIGHRCIGALLALVIGSLALPARAISCENILFENTPFTICEVSAQDRPQMWLRDGAGDILGGFKAIEAEMGGARLAFAMNAGMYHEDRHPVGLYIEDGRQVMPASDGGGYGNFGLLPNGLLCITEDSIRVWESTAWADAAAPCRYASQSGPMLVIDGTLHPAFHEGSSSRYVRNGVGTSDDGSRAVFAISDSAVNFYDFARLFRDHLGLNNALFFDANVSRLYAPALGRADGGPQVGPIVGVVDGAVDGADPAR